MFLATAAAPTNISLLTLGPQSINVTICPPAAIDQNGLILSYNVSYTGDPFDTLIQSQSFAVSLSYPATACVNVTLTGLEEFNNYTVSVQAVNSVGSGVSSAGVITRTEAAGDNYELIHIVTILCRAETNIRNVTNEPFSKRTNIRIFVRFDDYSLIQFQDSK